MRTNSINNDGHKHIPCERHYTVSISFVYQSNASYFSHWGLWLTWLWVLNKSILTDGAGLKAYQKVGSIFNHYIYNHLCYYCTSWQTLAGTFYHEACRIQSQGGFMAMLLSSNLGNTLLLRELDHIEGTLTALSCTYFSKSCNQIARCLQQKILTIWCRDATVMLWSLCFKGLLDSLVNNS